MIAALEAKRPHRRRGRRLARPTSTPTPSPPTARWRPRRWSSWRRRRAWASLAVTDHDTLDGVPEALAAGAALGVRVIPGVELSVRAPVAARCTCWATSAEAAPGAARRRAWPALREARGAARAARIVERLVALGAPVALEDVIARAGGPIGRPHIADALVAAGHARDRQDAFDRYLADGGPAYVPHEGIEPREAIAARGRLGRRRRCWPTRRRCGWTPATLADVRAAAARAGACAGIEVHRPDHTPERRRGLARARAPRRAGALRRLRLPPPGEDRCARATPATRRCRRTRSTGSCPPVGPEAHPLAWTHDHRHRTRPLRPPRGRRPLGPLPPRRRRRRGARPARRGPRALAGLRDPLPRRAGRTWTAPRLAEALAELAEIDNELSRVSSYAHLRESVDVTGEENKDLSAGGRPRPRRGRQRPAVLRPGVARAGRGRRARPLRRARGRRATATTWSRCAASRRTRCPSPRSGCSPSAARPRRARGTRCSGRSPRRSRSRSTRARATASSRTRSTACSPTCATPTATCAGARSRRSTTGSSRTPTRWPTSTTPSWATAWRWTSCAATPGPMDADAPAQRAARRASWRRMMDAVERHYALAHRWFRVKAGILGLDRLELHDQYAPIGEARAVDYPEATRPHRRVVRPLLPARRRDRRRASSPSAASTPSRARASAAAPSAPRSPRTPRPTSS